MILKNYGISHCSNIFFSPPRSTLASLTRFRSLNGGYGALKALETVDTILAGHLEELSVSFTTLSSNVLNDNDNHESSSMETFDEQQVQSALEVLKIAGVVRNELTSLEEQTRDQLRILSVRMKSTMEQESTLTDAVVKGVTNASAVPESMSVIEVEALLATAVCGMNEETGSSKSKSKPSSVTTAEQLSNANILNGEVHDLFPKAIDATNKLVRSCQSFVFDVCAFLPFQNMDSMSSMAIWGQEESMWASAAITADSYGTLPQSYITHVGEHMLALVQALEPFSADNDALNLANLVMEGVDHVADGSWREYARAIHCSELPSNEEGFISVLKKGGALKEFVLGQMQHSFDEDDEGNDNDEVEDTASQEFCNKWLDAVCSAVTSKLLERTMRIPKLSRKGCEHLSVDYNYIINVLSALGVSGHPHPLLSHIAELSSMDAESLQARIMESEEDEFGVRRAEIRIALMRSIPID